MTASSVGARVWELAKKTFTVLGAITFFGGGLALIVFSLTCLTREGVPPKTVLEVRLEAPLAEGSGGDGLAELLGEAPRSLRATIDALDRARDDDRVAGMVAYLDASAGGMARAQDLRDAVLRFRESGKFAIAYAETFGEMGPGTQGYYLASAFDEVWMQPTGQVGLVGLMSSSMFYKGTFEKLDVEVLGDRRREYKNAFDTYTQRRYTPAHEEAVSVLLDDLLSQIHEGIAQGRGVPAQSVATWIEEGPYLGSAAHAHGIVDHLGYRDEVVAAAKERAGEGAELLFLERYAERSESSSGGAKKVALVYGVGAVTRGPSSTDPLSGSQSMGSDTVAAALAAAAADEDVVAIVFRVDSPGGSAIASDTIWREAVRAREAGKPVIVSMGNVAASGGYYVAAGATKIVAQPGTITGSIGVFAGKPNLRKLWNKVGVSFDSVATSSNAYAFSTVHGYDEAGWQSLQASLDQIYADFKSRVAEGRGLTDAQVEAVAKGRVWSGVRAQELGLVDELGGLYDAVELARAEAGVSRDESSLVVYPPSKGIIEKLLGGDDRDNSESVRAEQVRTDLTRLRAWAKAAEAAGFGPSAAEALRMPSLSADGGGLMP
ncbi:MAG: signal peptide peptidase SppA [Nannocystaceae bacterium]|nr:signal peptide peptidase SppA [bacterium]